MGSRGFTLVELLIGTGLTLLVGLTLANVLTSSAALSQSLDTFSVVQAEARRALMAMERDLQQTGLNRVTIPAPPNLSTDPPTSIRFQVPIDKDGDGFITNAAGAIEWDSAPATFVTYSRNGSNQLIRSQPGQADRVLANGIQAVAFSIVIYPNTPAVNNQNDDLIAVDLTAQRAAPLLPTAPTMVLRATIRPRNTNK